MNYQIVNDIIKKQLIRSFAMLDACFDRDVVVRYYQPPSLSRNFTSWVTNVIHTNDFFLKEINKAATDPHKSENEVTRYRAEFASLAKAAENFTLPANRVAHYEYIELPVIRQQLRDQLYDCLLLLDLPTSESRMRHKTSFTINQQEPFKVYQLVYFMAMVVQKEVKDFDQQANGSRAEAVMQQEQVTDACCSNMMGK